MKVLYLGYVWPEPLSSAAGSRTLAICQLLLQAGCHLTFASAAQTSEHSIDFSHLGVPTLSIAINDDSFDQVLENIMPDMVIFDRFFTEEQYGWRVDKVCPQALRVLDTCDLHALREVRWQKLKAEQAQWESMSDKHHVGAVLSTPEALFEAMSQNMTAQREIASIWRCDLSLVISSFEMQLLQNHFNIPSYLLCYSPIMMAAHIQHAPPYLERQHFVSIGNFHHPPNWDAVNWLKHAIWPLIRSQLPDAQCHIYGAYMPDKARAYHNESDGFLIKGRADQVHHIMSQAKVCLAPLRFGAGLKGKLLDALVCATPSVATHVAIEGMGEAAQWAGLVEDDTFAYAQAAIRLYEDASLWETCSQRSRLIVQNQFDDCQHLAYLWQCLEEAMRHKEARRIQNFTGTMLKHHQHKSTQYMSQWIMLKNQIKEDKVIQNLD